MSIPQSSYDSISKLVETYGDVAAGGRFERAIKTADAKIDTLVYGLYGLTEKEIKVVEG